MRPALEAVRSGDGDEVTARRILATVAPRRPDWKTGEPFNLRYARSRLSVIALVELRPHDLRTGEFIDLSALLNSDEELAPQIMTYRPAGVPAEWAAAFSSVGNRLLHPSGGDVSILAMLVTAARPQIGLPSMPISASPHVFASHAISEEAMLALRKDDRVGFLEIRRDQIEAATVSLVDRHAEWEHSDRLSIAALSDEED